MGAITVRPGKANSAQLEEVAGPPPFEGAVLVRAGALGVRGSDREIVSGEYGSISRRVRLERRHDALDRQPDDIKVVIEFP
jgi:glucose 1-dehydrogenase